MKEKRFTKGIIKRLLSVALAVAMVLPSMMISATPVYADVDKSSWPTLDEYKEHLLSCNHESDQHFYFAGGSFNTSFEGQDLTCAYGRTFGGRDSDAYTYDVTPEGNVFETRLLPNGVSSEVGWYCGNYGAEHYQRCGSGSGAPTCSCTNDGHEMHQNVYKIEGDKVYIHRYNGNTYQNDYCLTTGVFESSYGEPVLNGWYYYYGLTNEHGVCTEAGGSGGGSGSGAANTFTLTVPAEVPITGAGWNDIGNVVIEADIASDKKVVVTIEDGATGRTLKKDGASEKTIGYEVKKGTLAPGEDFGTALEFTGSGTQAIGAVVNGTDFAEAAAGTYEDIITFTAELADNEGGGAGGSSYTTAGGKTLNFSDLGDATSWTYNGTYDVYYGFIPHTSGSSWNDAMGFVDALNSANYDEHNDWMLLSSQLMAQYLTYEESVTTSGDVRFLWSSVEGSAGEAYHVDITGHSWVEEYKSTANSDCGFVVLRPSSSY